MKKIQAIALAVLSLAACQQNEKDAPVVAGKLCVEPLISKATEVNFEDSDMIGLSVVAEGSTENYATNAALTYSSNIFSGDLEWYGDAYTKSDLYAYYPYSSEGVPASYTQFTDQSEGIGAADFMMAVKKGVLPTSNAVTMVFKHVMSKLVINIDNESGFEIENVEVMSLTQVAGLDYENLTVKDYEGEVIEEMPVTVPYEAVAGETWQMIMIPQTVSLELRVTLANKTVISQSLVSTTYKSGGQYTINARVLSDEMEVVATGEIQNWTDEGDVAFEGSSSSEQLPVEFSEYEGYFVYDGVRYNTVTLADGNTWMAENLRFIPRGRTVSSDPAQDAGIWYPAANANKTADPALAETLGLLYDVPTAFGVSEITADNAASFEGCQGICPTGWHIPTVAEMTGLVGYCSNSAMIDTEGAYYDSTIKGASLAALETAGWAWQFASARNKGNTGATGSYLVTNYNGIYGVASYLIGSTMYKVQNNTDGSLKNVQYYYFMPLYNASNEKVTVAYGNFLSGASLRCIKNK